MPDVIATQTGAPLGDGQADRQEAGGALVDPHVQTQPAGAVGVVQRERQRRVARARAQHDVADAAANQFVDDDAGLCRRGVHRYSVGLSAKKSSTAALTASRVLDEPEVAGVGNLQVAAVGHRVGDLAAEVGGSTTSSANPMTSTGAVMAR